MVDIITNNNKKVNGHRVPVSTEKHKIPLPEIIQAQYIVIHGSQIKESIGKVSPKNTSNIQGEKTWKSNLHNPKINPT